MQFLGITLTPFYETMRYTFDANNNVVRTEMKNFDHLGVLQSNTHWNQTFEYEVLNRLVRATDEVEDGRSLAIEFDYDRNRKRRLVRYGEAANGNQPANTVTMEYDERDLLFREITAKGHPDQSTVQYDYDGNRNQVALREGLEEDPRTTTMIHDGYDRLVGEVDPMGNERRYEYDANHNRVTQTAFGELNDVPGNDGNVRLAESIHVFDPLNRAIRSDRAHFDAATDAAIGDGVARTVAEYNGLSQRTRLLNDNDHAVDLVYDTANRLASVIDAKKNVATYTYDLNSNIVEVSSLERSELMTPDQIFATHIEYDNLDRLVAVIDNVGNRVDFGLDSRHLRVFYRDPNGNVIRHVYDGIDRLIATVRELTATGDGTGDPAGEIVTRTEYDDSSRVVARIDDNGNRMSYAYDPLSRVVEEQSADGSSATVTYDVHHTLITRTDANGTVVNNSYDLNDRVIERGIDPGTGVSSDTTFESFQYDGLSRMVLGEDDDSQVDFAYDSLSRRTLENQNGHSVRRQYDGVGNLLLCEYPGGREIVCTFDELERKQQVSDAAGLIAEYSFVGPDRVQQRRYGNGTQTDYTFDGITGVPNSADDFAVKKLVGIRHATTVGDAVIDERQFAYDRVYNKALVVDPQAKDQIEIRYDSAYRMIQSAHSLGGDDPQTVDYTFDGVGNRTEISRGTLPGTYALDKVLPSPGDLQVNQYTSTPFDDRAYDENGNLTTINQGQTEEAELAFDYRNQLVSYSNVATASSARYTYDVLGRRIKRVLDGGTFETTHYVYSGWQVIEERDAADAVLATYVYGHGIDEVLSMQRAGNTFYYHSDDLSSVTAVTDESANVVERYRYADYGEPDVLDPSGLARSVSEIINPYGFTGRRYDPETGWYYYRTRLLDPLVGRFVSRDRIGVWTDTINMGNGNSYVGNNPYTLADPHGRFAAGPAVAATATGVAEVATGVAATVSAATVGAGAAGLAIGYGIGTGVNYLLEGFYQWNLDLLFGNEDMQSPFEDTVLGDIYDAMAGEFDEDTIEEPYGAERSDPNADEEEAQDSEQSTEQDDDVCDEPQDPKPRRPLNPPDCRRKGSYIVCKIECYTRPKPGEQDCDKRNLCNSKIAPGTGKHKFDRAAALRAAIQNAKKAAKNAGCDVPDENCRRE